MNKQNSSRLIKSGLLYFLFIQLIALLTLVISIFLITPIRLIFNATMSQNYCICIAEIISELLITVIIFYKYQKSEKLSFPEFALPCIIAYPLHFLLSILNGFYIYTAGSASTLSDLLWSISAGTVVAHADIPAYFNILIFTIMLILKFTCLVIIFIITKKGEKQ